jgi:hypothetical protein
MTTFRVSRPFLEFWERESEGSAQKKSWDHIFKKKGSVFLFLFLRFASPFDEMLLKCCRVVAETLLFVVGYSHVLFLTFHVFF